MSNQDDFESARLLSLRCFEVLLANGETIRVFAHLHDGGENPGGHLNFITINREGRQTISRSLNARCWSDLSEVASDLVGTTPKVDETLPIVPPSTVPPKGQSRRIH